MTTLSFYGAAGEVTGSCYLVQTGQARVLVDFGFHQGTAAADTLNRTIPPIDAAKLDAVVLTHAHLDHCGRLPQLLRQGFKGPVYATAATADLTGIILRDSASLQEADAIDDNRRRVRDGMPPLPPLYTHADAEQILRQFKEVAYGRTQEIARGVTIRMFDAGHIIGSASVQMVVGDGKPDGTDLVIDFSGDIGVTGAPILRDPQPPDRPPADVVVLESTYGDRNHRPLAETLDELVAIISAARAENGCVLVPAFSVGRTQDIIYHMSSLMRQGRLPSPLPVFIDSPMATAASELYERYTDLYDADAMQIDRSGDSPLDFPGLRYTRSRDESMALNDRQGFFVVIAGSGMCTGGRIVHHLRHNLAKPSTRVVIVGYQAMGTLGRELVNGAKVVRIFRDSIPVNARIHTLGGFSAHAGQSDLLKWAAAVAPSKPKVFLTHGEEPPRAALGAKLKAELGLEAFYPKYADTATL